MPTKPNVQALQTEARQQKHVPVSDRRMLGRITLQLLRTAIDLIPPDTQAQKTCQRSFCCILECRLCCKARFRARASQPSKKARPFQMQRFFLFLLTLCCELVSCKISSEQGAERCNRRQGFATFSCTFPPFYPSSEIPPGALTFMLLLSMHQTRFFEACKPNSLLAMLLNF
eukprot:1138819-Pelagomonas_calceolata.AAC.3